MLVAPYFLRCPWPANFICGPLIVYFVSHLVIGRQTGSVLIFIKEGVQGWSVLQLSSAYLHVRIPTMPIRQFPVFGSEYRIEGLLGHRDTGPACMGQPSNREGESVYVREARLATLFGQPSRGCHPAGRNGQATAAKEPVKQLPLTAPFAM